MRFTRIISRLILGVVFIFSSFVKAVDPVGSAYKFSDYFVAFRLGFLEFLTVPLGIFLSAFEFVLGMSLILGYQRRMMYPVLMWFMTFFTLLTLGLAIFNPVSDCGCFGDALILTNWETFLKNLVLMVFVLWLYLQRKREPESKYIFREWTVIALIFFSVCWFSVWNYRHIPLLDFRPYDVGTEIRKEMEIPQDAPVDEYETKLTYRNRSTGISEEFTIENYPKDTAVWEFVSSESKLVKKGYEPPIHDFALMDRYGNNMVDRILDDRGYSLVMVSHNLAGADKESLLRAGEWFRLEMLSDDFSFYAVTASPSDEVADMVSSLQPGYDFYSADEIMLKTVVRSNPGFMLVKNGIIVGKWGFRDFPSVGDVDPGWPEMIGNASVPVEEEVELLKEAGVYEAISYNVVEFDRYATRLLFEKNASAKEKRVIIAFILAVCCLILVFHMISPLKG